MMEDTTLEDNSLIVGNKTEDIPAELVSTGEAEPASDGVTSEPEENGEKELPAANSDNASPDEESSSDEEPSKVTHDPPPKDAVSPALEGEEGGAGEAENGRDGCFQALRELREERDRAGQHGGQLQTKLAEYFRKKAGEDARLERGRAEAVLRQEYDGHLRVLAGLKRQIAREAEEARAQAEELRVQTEEKRAEVDKEWRGLVASKQEVAVAALSRRLGKEAAQARVASALAAERLRRDELTGLRLRHAGLRTRIRRLEAELGEEAEQGRDPLLVQFDQLQASRLEQKRNAEKQNEECSKLRKKLGSCSEDLAGVKARLQGSQAEARAMRGRLAAAEAELAGKREVLAGTKRALKRLQRDNLGLKERRGLLGNRVLLRDFQDAADASERLEAQLGNLRRRRAEIGYGRGGWREQAGGN